MQPIDKWAAGWIPPSCDSMFGLEKFNRIDSILIKIGFQARREIIMTTMALTRRLDDQENDGQNHTFAIQLVEKNQKLLFRFAINAAILNWIESHRKCVKGYMTKTRGLKILSLIVNVTAVTNGPDGYLVLAANTRSLRLHWPGHL